MSDPLTKPTQWEIILKWGVHKLRHEYLPVLGPQQGYINVIF